MVINYSRRLQSSAVGCEVYRLAHGTVVGKVETLAGVNEMPKGDWG